MIYQSDGIAVNYGDTVGLYHVFIIGCKPKSFVTLDDVQDYIYKKTRRVIQFVSEKADK